MAAKIVKGQCQCGKNQFTVSGSALFRCFCHCTICQQFNQAPFADVSVYRSDALDLKDCQHVDFKAYASPEILQRGRCSECQNPVIEFLTVPLLPKLVVLPNNTLIEPTTENACGHIFYHRRVDDIDDQLPKHSGYLTSQTVFSAYMLKGLLRK